MTPSAFSKKVLKWFDQHGRKHLPWQQNISAYRVWVSEIMLQQTQVTTVIPYFEKFMQQFPDVHALASADINTVLHLWTGLGYYARARNLHKTAQIIMSDYNGEFPQELDALQSLPGIGRSTAGAISAIAFQKHATILDGNVKRVLARYHAIPGWYGETKVLKQLWQVAEKYTPKSRVADYTQAMMDLGAMICTRGKPQCTECPLQNNCEAYLQNKVDEFPHRKPKKQKPIRNTLMVMLRHDNHKILLEQRPAQGIWGGLWTPPMRDSEKDLVHWCKQQYGVKVNKTEKLPSFRHTFSHFHLDIDAIVADIDVLPRTVMEKQQRLWYNLQQPEAIGLAAPIKKLLEQLVEKST